jgi:hypothetical protein
LNYIVTQEEAKKFLLRLPRATPQLQELTDRIKLGWGFWSEPVFQEALGGTCNFELLERPFQNYCAEVTKAAPFFGSTLFQLGPESRTDPDADLNFPLTHRPGFFSTSEINFWRKSIEWSD